MKVSVIGSGGWGTALAALLKNNGHDVTLWSYLKSESDSIRENGENKEFLPGIKLPLGIKYTSDLKEAATGAKLYVFATPSHAVFKTAEAISNYIEKNVPIVNVAKGFDVSSQKRLSGVISEVMPNNPVAVLSGPSHAEEVAKEIPTTVVVASKDKKTAEKVQDVFMSPVFRVYTHDDIVGVEIGGALKNIIALCAGISDGLGLGDNTKAALMTRGLAEISRLGKKMGANPHTFAGLAGVGDLIVTCTSMHSRNRRAGILIGQGQTVDDALKTVHMVVEGVMATKSAHVLAQQYGVEMPITKAAYEILFNNKKPADEVKRLMNRNKKNESEEEAVWGEGL